MSGVTPTYPTCVMRGKDRSFGRDVDNQYVQWLYRRVDPSLSEKVKLVSGLELPDVTQASVAKKYGVSIYIAGFIPV